MTDQALSLANTPDWQGAAEQLLSSFVSLDNLDHRLDVLDAVCNQLEHGLYPAFLHILFIIEQHATASEKMLVADTFLHALKTNRLPEGQVPAWGANITVDNSGYSHRRKLGPLEFTCAWLTQPGSMTPISEHDFALITSSFIRLFSTTETTRKLYCARVLEEAHDTVNGSLSSATRSGLIQLTDGWLHGTPANALADQYIKTTSSAPGLAQIKSNPFT